MQEPTAGQVATAFSHGLRLHATTHPGRPSGCLGVQGSLATGASARDLLIAWRNDGVTRLRERFQQSVDEGDLPSDADPGLLARYLMTVSNGIAVQAASGATRDDLQPVAERSPPQLATRLTTTCGTTRVVPDPSDVGAPVKVVGFRSAALSQFRQKQNLTGSVRSQTCVPKLWVGRNSRTGASKRHLVKGKRPSSNYQATGVFAARR